MYVVKKKKKKIRIYEKLEGSQATDKCMGTAF